jgi:hypothetical protein
MHRETAQAQKFPAFGCWPDRRHRAKAPPEGRIRGRDPAHALRFNRISEDDRRRIEETYSINVDDLAPRVYYRMTDNWLELTLRFIVREHGVRDVKDALSRDILQHFEEAGIEIASATFELVGLHRSRWRRRPRPRGAATAA